VFLWSGAQRASKQQHIHLTALLYAVVARETDTDTVHMREVCSLPQEPNSTDR